MTRSKPKIIWNESDPREAFVVDPWHLWGDNVDYLREAQSWHFDHDHMTLGPEVCIWNGERFVRILWDPERDSVDVLYLKERRIHEAFKGKPSVGKHVRFFARLLVGAVAEGVVQGVRRL